MHIRSMPTRMSFGGRVTPSQQILNRHRREFAISARRYLALNPADAIFVRDNEWFESIRRPRRHFQLLGLAPSV